MERILIVRTGSLGDIVHTLPAVSTLKHAFPQAQLDWVVERQWAPLLARNPHLARVQELETHAWRRRPASSATWRSVFTAIRVLRARHYDSALDFQGLLKSAVIARLSGAATIVGFDRGEAREAASALFYTFRVRPRDKRRATRHRPRLRIGPAAAQGGAESGDCRSGGSQRSRARIPGLPRRR